MSALRTESRKSTLTRKPSQFSGHIQIVVAMVLLVCAYLKSPATLPIAAAALLVIGSTAKLKRDQVKHIDWVVLVIFVYENMLLVFSHHSLSPSWTRTICFACVFYLYGRCIGRCKDEVVVH